MVNTWVGVWSMETMGEERRGVSRADCREAGLGDRSSLAVSSATVSRLAGCQGSWEPDGR